VAIVPDARTNQLLIRGSQSDFQLIQAAVERVDVRPLQVLIEATVAFVSREFALDFGVEQARIEQTAVEGTTNTTIGGSATGVTDAASLFIRIFKVGGVDLDVVLRAGERRGNVAIVSHPVVLAANNEEAEIVVGDQIPFVQLERSTEGGVLDQVVQYKDVGTRLMVIPTISRDGHVALQVVQEVNDVTGAGTLQAPPPISTRSIRTQLLIRDGQTAVLGGLASINRERTSNGIPLLSSIPILGGLFGAKHREDRNAELFIFITPHVIYSDDDLNRVSDEVRDNSRYIRRNPDRLEPFVGREKRDQPEPQAPSIPPQTPPSARPTP
jgi:general secretion pathway protein D